MKDFIYCLHAKTLGENMERMSIMDCTGKIDHNQYTLYDIKYDPTKEVHHLPLIVHQSVGKPVSSMQNLLKLNRPTFREIIAERIGPTIRLKVELLNIELIRQNYFAQKTREMYSDLQKFIQEQLVMAQVITKKQNHYMQVTRFCSEQWSNYAGTKP